MGIRMKVAALAVVTVLSAALVTVSAQTSNTNSATAGLFRTATDNFMSVNDFTDVKFDKAFGFLGLSSGSFAAGYATHLGGLYLGVYYNGFALRNNDVGEETETETADYDDGSGAINGREKTTYTTYKDDDGNVLAPLSETNNNIAALLGIGSMGLKLGFYEDTNETKDRWEITTTPDDSNTSWTNLNSFVDNGNVDDGNHDEVTVVYDADGNMVSKTVAESYPTSVKNDDQYVPYLNWGMPIALGDSTLNLGANFTFVFRTDAFETTNVAYSQVFNAGNPSYAGKDDLVSYSKKGYAYAKGYYHIDGGLSLSFDVAPAGSREMSFGIDYVLGTKIYSNAYDKANGGSGTAAGTAAWYSSKDFTWDNTEEVTTEVGAHEVTERSYMSHTITPSFTYKNALSERLRFGFKAVVATFLDSYTAKRSGKLVKEETTVSASGNPANDSVVTTVKNYSGYEEEGGSFTLTPNFNLGLTYAAVPEKFTVNAGIAVSVPKLTSISRAQTRSGITTITETTVTGTGTETVTAYDDTVGDDRYEYGFELLDWNGLGATLSTGFNWNLGGGVFFDVLASSTGFTVNASSLTVQCSILR